MCHPGRPAPQGESQEGSPSLAAFQRANNQLQDIKKELNAMVKGTIPSLESELKAAGAPWIEGQGLIQN